MTGSGPVGRGWHHRGWNAPIAPSRVHEPSGALSLAAPHPTSASRSLWNQPPRPRQPPSSAGGRVTIRSFTHRSPCDCRWPGGAAQRSDRQPSVAARAAGGRLRTPVTRGGEVVVVPTHTATTSPSVGRGSVPFQPLRSGAIGPAPPVGAASRGGAAGEPRAVAPRRRRTGDGGGGRPPAPARPPRRPVPGDRTLRPVPGTARLLR
jgi:hypothetical protein